jgi:hypothetical protein
MPALKPGTTTDNSSAGPLATPFSSRVSTSLTVVRYWWAKYVSLCT